MAAASPTVTATVDTGVDVVPARQKSERDPELAESTKDVGRRIREGDAFADKHAKFALAYASLLSLLVVGLGLAGLSSTRWLSYRIITQSPNGPSMAFHHLGLWSECGPNGCTHVNAVDAPQVASLRLARLAHNSPHLASPQFVNVARGFGILFVCLGLISWLFVTVASAKVGAVTGAREGGAHRDMAKLVRCAAPARGPTHRGLTSAAHILTGWQFLAAHQLLRSDRDVHLCGQAPRPAADRRGREQRVLGLVVRCLHLGVGCCGDVHRSAVLHCELRTSLGRGSHPYSAAEDQACSVSLRSELAENAAGVRVAQ